MLSNLVLMKNTTKQPLKICLSGSTSRALQEFKDANLFYTLHMMMVYSIGCDTHSDTDLNIDTNTKLSLDILHLFKIDVSDILIVLNKGGYIGDSTNREIDYALMQNKEVIFLEDNSRKQISVCLCQSCRKFPKFSYTLNEINRKSNGKWEVW